MRHPPNLRALRLLRFHEKKRCPLAVRARDAGAATGTLLDANHMHGRAAVALPGDFHKLILGSPSR
jgi:hypothetical protein